MTGSPDAGLPRQNRLGYKGFRTRLDSVRGAHRPRGRPQHPVLQRWFDEAAKYNGLPLTDLNILETMTRWRPYLAGERTSFTYYPNSAAVGLGAMVEIRGQSFSILAEVTTKPATQGVIFKQGGAHGGHVLFIDEHAVGALRDVEIHLGTFGLAGASLSIGRNGGSVVSSGYPAHTRLPVAPSPRWWSTFPGSPTKTLEKKLAIVFAKD